MHQRLRTGAFLGISLSLCMVAASAQRRLPPMFADTAATLTGAVVQVMAMNPHTLVIFDATPADPGAEAVRWQAILPAQQILRSCFGWTRTSIRPGDVILVTGHAARSGAPLMTLLEVDSEMVAGTGQTLFSGARGIALRGGAPCVAPRPAAPGPTGPAR